MWWRRCGLGSTTPFFSLGKAAGKKNVSLNQAIKCGLHKIQKSKLEFFDRVSNIFPQISALPSTRGNRHSHRVNIPNAPPLPAPLRFLWSEFFYFDFQSKFWAWKSGSLILCLYSDNLATWSAGTPVTTSSYLRLFPLSLIYYPRVFQMFDCTGHVNGWRPGYEPLKSRWTFQRGFQTQRGRFSSHSFAWGNRAVHCAFGHVNT